jgi:hypothetical protein
MLSFTTLHAQSLTFVGNNTGYTSVSLTVMKNVFKGKYSVWSNKESITIVLPSSKASNAESVASYLYGTSFSGMQKYWFSKEELIHRFSWTMMMRLLNTLRITQELWAW